MDETTAVMAETPDQMVAEVYTLQRVGHWDRIAREIDRDQLASKYYHQRLREIYRFLIPPQASILEIGCGKGDLLAALEPSAGMGIDFSEEMIAQARIRYPQQRFLCADAHSFEVDGVYDYIILSDLINDCWDVQTVFNQIQKVMHSGTRMILNVYSRLWQPLLNTSQKLNLAIPQLQQNWLTVEDIRNLLYISGYDVMRSWQECIFPAAVPLLSRFLNKDSGQNLALKSLGLIEFYRGASIRGQPEVCCNPCGFCDSTGTQ